MTKFVQPAVLVAAVVLDVTTIRTHDWHPAALGAAACFLVVTWRLVSARNATP